MFLSDISLSVVFSFLCCLRRFRTQEHFRIARIEASLGSGAFSEVFKVVGNNGRYYALKKMSGRDDEESANQLQNEIEILKLIHQRTTHVQYFLKTYPSDHLSGHLCILMEYLAGAQDLLEYLNDPDLYQEVVKSTQLVGGDNLIFQMIASVVALHKVGVMHRDIKLENFLFEHRTKQLKLIDFGLSDPIGEKAKVKKGTLGFIPPEILFSYVSHKIVNEKCDVWSLGVTLFCVLTNTTLFDQKSLCLIQYYHDLNDYYHDRSHSSVKKNFDTEALNASKKESVRALNLQLKSGCIFSTIERMLQKELSLRPSASEVLHNFK